MTDLFEYSTYIKANESLGRNEAIKLAQARAVDSGWTVERIVSYKDLITNSETLFGYEIVLLVHRER